MTRKQKIIFDDLTKHFRDRAATVISDFIDRCEESDIPISDIMYTVTITYTRMALYMMIQAGFTRAQCAKFVNACTEEFAKAEKRDGSV